MPAAWGAGAPSAASATAPSPAPAPAEPAASAAGAGDGGEPRSGEVALPFKRSARKPIGATLPPSGSATATPAATSAALAKSPSSPAEPAPSAAQSEHGAHAAAPPRSEASSSATHPQAQAASPPVAEAKSAPPAAAPRPAQDPLDALRDKLAQRLSARSDPKGKSSVSVNVAPTAPGEFQLKVQQAPAQHGGAAHGASGARSARSGASPQHGAKGTSGAHSAPALGGHGTHWTYEGSSGPQSWGSLNPDFQTCDRGQRQSPIDIRGGLPLDLEPLQFDYQDGFFSVTDNGHTLDTKPAGVNSLVVGTRRFELQGLHFHRPAEERVDGKSFAMSVHLVHKDAQGRLAVVGLLVEEGPENPAVQTLWNHIPLERGETTVSSGAFNPASLLPAKRGYFTYMGSLTTPPCSEGVLWMVMQTPINLSAQQLATFARLYAHNARPIQPDHGRIIKQSR